MNKNISRLFIVPSLGISRETLENNGFLNSYMQDAGLTDQYKDCCYLLFSPKNMPKFQDFLDQQYDENLALVTDYDICAKTPLIVLVYRMDPYFEKDYELVKQGKYSKVSDEYKSLFAKKIKVLKDGRWMEEDSLHWKIFNKDDMPREYWESRIGQAIPADNEVWSAWRDDLEVLDVEKVKQQLK